MRAGTGLVFIDRPPALIDADAVLLDNVGGARTAVRHLLGLGHRRIAMIGDEKRIFTAAERLHGYRDALDAAGQPFDPSLVRLGAHDADAAAAAVRDVLTIADPPTAIFTANNRITVGAIGVLRRGRRRRAALVGFDDFELAESLATPTTVVAYDAEELGRKAAELLLLRLAGDQRPPQRVVLPTRLIERESGELRP